MPPDGLHRRNILSVLGACAHYFRAVAIYFTGRRNDYLHFAVVFLLVNLIGFTFYYIHPAAPPWYVALHGFEAVPGTPGSVAGLGAF